MRYFRDSLLKYPTKTGAWRLNDNGTVDYRDYNYIDWEPAHILTDWLKIEDAIMMGNLEECSNPFKDFDE